jgi:hypothetical protein
MNFLASEELTERLRVSGTSVFKEVTQAMQFYIASSGSSARLAAQVFRTPPAIWFCLYVRPYNTSEKRDTSYRIGDA